MSTAGSTTIKGLICKCLSVTYSGNNVLNIEPVSGNTTIQGTLNVNSNELKDRDIQIKGD